jgi:hypothetical protein
MANQIFYYLGDDEAFFKNLTGEFKRSCKYQADFKKISKPDEKEIQSLFIKIFNERPICVFLDFTKNTQDYLHLARLISRTPLEHKMITVGLVDNLLSREIMHESIAVGVNLTHVKGPENFDIVFDIMKLIAPNEMGEHGFAKASLKEEWSAGIPVKVGYVQQDGIHFETDYQLQKGDRIKLKHEWMKKRTVPSSEVFITKTSTMNLFYQFKHAVDAEFLFVDEFLPPEGMEEDRIAEKKQEREELIIHQRKLLTNWINDNDAKSVEKRAKILIIDREFLFFKDQERTDRHPYTVRCVPYLNDIGQELDRLEPQVIAFAFDKEDAKDPRNTNEVLIKLMDAVKNKIQDTSPFVIVFNCKHNSKKMQDSFGYAQLMASESELSVDVLVKIADAFEKKLMAENTTQTPHAPKVYLKKSNTASIAEILVPIKVLKLSETDMVLQSDVPLETGMNIHLTSPVDMYVNIQPSKTQGKVPEYQGLIHCLGEGEKKELRRYVNAIFFRDHDAQVSAESDEFKKLNEIKLVEKVEAAKKAQAEADAAASENADGKEKKKTPA